MSALKVPAFVTCLMRLHNFCIDHDSRRTPSSIVDDERQIRRVASREPRRQLGGRGRRRVPSSSVRLDSVGRPTDLLASGHHFRDNPSGRRPPARQAQTPMRKMIQKVEFLDLRRPRISDR